MGKHTQIANELPNLLEDVPLRERETLIFQHDGAPAYYCKRVREILDNRFPDRWIGRGGPIVWPARSPDLNVLDYFVWGFIKASVEHRRDGTRDEVRNEILAAFHYSGYGAPSNTANCSKSRTLFGSTRKAHRTITSLEVRSGLGLSGKPLKKKRVQLSTSRWCRNDSVSLH
jgi:hypothetical protein